MELNLLVRPNNLGKANSESDDATNSAAVFELAENSVIDKHIKEADRNLLPKEDIVDFDQSEFEDVLLSAVNKSLEALGVQISALSFVPIPSEQTAQAIDVAKASKVYQAKALEEVDKTIMAERAGVTKITVENKVMPNGQK